MSKDFDLYLLVALMIACLVTLAVAEPAEPTGETIVYRTDRLPLPCEEMSE